MQTSQNLWTFWNCYSPPSGHKFFIISKYTHPFQGPKVLSYYSISSKFGVLSYNYIQGQMSLVGYSSLYSYLSIEPLNLKSGELKKKAIHSLPKTASVKWWWGRKDNHHRRFCSDRQKTGGVQQSLAHSNSEIHVGTALQWHIQGLIIIPLSFWFCPLGAWFHKVILFSMKGSMCLHLNGFLSWLPAYRTWVSKGLFLFCTLSLSDQAGNVSNNTMPFKILWTSCESYWISFNKIKIISINIFEIYLFFSTLGFCWRTRV